MLTSVCSFFSIVEQRVAASGSWGPPILSLLSGAVMAFALPGHHYWPVLLICLPLWALLLDQAAGKWRGFWLGWWFGFGYFALGLYWIGNSFAVRSEALAWMAPFAVAGLSAGLALFMALTGFAYVALMRPVPLGAQESVKRLHGFAGPLALAGLWTLAEWLRIWIFTGFPWNMVGYVWSGIPFMEQAAALIGVLGLSFVTLFSGAALRQAFRAKERGGSWKPLICACVLLAGLSGYGTVRLTQNETLYVPDVHLRLIQPSIPQTLKWRKDLLDLHFKTYLKMTRSAGFEKITHVIWPETAVPFLGQRRLKAIAGLGLQADGALMTGAPRYQQRSEGGYKTWNSLFVVSHQGEIVSAYDKVHLVPFGEYMPFKEWLPLAKMTHGGQDFTPGETLMALSAGSKAPLFTPLICYEIIFPGHVTPSVEATGEKPGWILNITNDAWFGDSDGPRQHFHITRFRAIEEGMPVVRSANSGISAIIDPFGRTMGRLDLGQKAVLDGALPKAVSSTLFSWTGNWLMLSFAFAAIAFAAVARYRLGWFSAQRVVD